MRGKVEPSIMPKMVKVVLIVVHATRQIIEIPQMTSPYKRLLINMTSIQV